MLVLLRALLVAFVASGLFAPLVAEAQNYPMPYAKLLTANEAREMLHCPLCDDFLNAAEGLVYVVRTAEDLNLVFANVVSAQRAAELLNWMAGARNECSKKAYDLAFEEYSEMMALGSASGRDSIKIEIRTSVPLLLTLSEYVVPTLYGCTKHRVVSRKLSPYRATRSGSKWSRR